MITKTVAGLALLALTLTPASFTFDENAPVIRLGEVCAQDNGDCTFDPWRTCTLNGGHVQYDYSGGREFEDELCDPWGEETDSNGESCDGSAGS